MDLGYGYKEYLCTVRWPTLKHLIVVLLALQISSFINEEPVNISWKSLSETSFSEYFNETKNIWTLEGLFPMSIRELNGSDVKITGYVIPLDIKERSYVLSAYPYSSCYFCGGAGPESIVNLQLNDLKDYIETDAIKTFSGVLVLQSRPKNGFYFTLINARIEN